MIENKKWDIKDIIFFFILLLEDAGTFNILPIGIAQILIVFLGIVIIQHNKQRNGFFLNTSIFFFMIYMFGITIVHQFDIESLRGIALFFVELLVLYFYVNDISSYEKLLSIIYKAAFVLAVIGIVQEISYLAGINFLTDMTIFGFPRANVYSTGHILARVSSLYSEPASLCSILAAAFFTGLFGKKINGVSKSKTISIICFIMFAQSSVIYVALIVILTIYTLYSDVSKSRKIIICGIAVVVIAILFLGDFDFVSSALQKLDTLKSASSENSTDLSAFAIQSNFKIALAKIKDGYFLGTGFNSHRLYYDNYLNQFYSNVYMKLNYSDAGSIYTRSLSEFGIVGFVYLIVGLISRLCTSIKRQNNFLIVCTTILMIAFVRDGNYHRSLGITLFIIVFFISKHRNINIENISK